MYSSVAFRGKLRRGTSCRFPRCTKCYYVAIGSGKKYKNLKFYRFPVKSKKQQLDKWKKICKLNKTVNCENYFVCENHFVENDFVNYTRHRLNYDVVPKHLELVQYQQSFFPLSKTAQNEESEDSENEKAGISVESSVPLETALQSANTLIQFLEHEDDTFFPDILVLRRIRMKIKHRIAEAKGETILDDLF